MASFFRILAPFLGILSSIGMLLSYSYLPYKVEPQTFSVNYVLWARASLSTSRPSLLLRVEFNCFPFFLDPQLTHAQDRYSLRSYNTSQIPGVGVITGFVDGRILG